MYVPKYNEVKMKVEWIDAADHDDVPLKDIKENPVKKYLINVETYGEIIKEDDDGIIVMKAIDSNDDCEIIAIPRQWLKRSKGVNLTEEYNGEE